MSKNKKTMTSSAPVPYFSISSCEEDKTANIYIFGDIAHNRGGLAGLFQADSDQSSYDLARQVQNIPEDYEIVVHINSNGGELKEGLGIYNVLKSRNVTTVCEGFAASAGSVIFCAGKHRVMQPASLLFIHQASMTANGNSDDFAKASEDLKIITESAVAAYREAGINISDDELHRMLKEETWITPEDAVKMGFATQIADEDPEDEFEPRNDAMRSIMAAVTKGKEVTQGREDTDIRQELEEIKNSVESYRDIMEMAKSALSIISADQELVVKLKAVAHQVLATNPMPEPAKVGNKGFFNFNKPEGEGGTK